MTWHKVTEKQCNSWPCWIYDGQFVRFALKPYRKLPVNGVEWFFEPGVTHWKKFPSYPKPPKLDKSNRKTCSKCKKRRQVGETICEGGQLFHFCNECFERFKAWPQTNSLRKFLEETQVDKNIREARERRARGEFMWIKK